jgi:hypothetical protein
VELENSIPPPRKRGALLVAMFVISFLDVESTNAKVFVMLVLVQNVLYCLRMSKLVLVEKYLFSC